MAAISNNCELPDRRHGPIRGPMYVPSQRWLSTADIDSTGSRLLPARLGPFGLCRECPLAELNRAGGTARPVGITLFGIVVCIAGMLSVGNETV
jgi:hypothetical protein